MNELAPLIRSRLWRFINLFTYLFTYLLESIHGVQASANARKCRKIAMSGNVDEMSDAMRSQHEICHLIWRRHCSDTSTWCRLTRAGRRDVGWSAAAAGQAEECRLPDSDVYDVMAAKLHCTLLYGSNTVVVSLSVLDLDCTQSISFPVFLKWCYSACECEV